MPSNILYSELELPHHLLELNLNQQTMDHLTETYEGVESDPVQKFKCAVEKYFLDSRSIALESLREGLTLNGESSIHFTLVGVHVACSNPFLSN